MKAEIITIGDEILIGQVIDTNSAWIAHELNLIGVKVNQITSIQDNRTHILEAINNAEKRAEVVLITGGLGPTKDDITKQVLCEYFETELVLNKKALENIQRIFALRNYHVSELNRKQAELPIACQAIENSEGTASGMWFEKNGKVIVSMPGVPFEMKTMMVNHILPKIKTHFKTPVIFHKTLLTTGIAESTLAELIEDWENSLPSNIKLAYLPSPGIVKLRLSGTGERLNVLTSQIEKQIKDLKTIVEKYFFGFNEDKLEEIIGRLLQDNGFTISTAESCTGGFVSHLITSIPGSSSYFMGGVLAYNNKIKIKELDVSSDVIDCYGAVSREVVEQMALGISNKYQTDFSIATSGIAGPGGATLDKPVGTVWIAVKSLNEKVVSKKFLFGENRERNIQKATIAGLNMLRKEILRNII